VNSESLNTTLHFNFFKPFYIKLKRFWLQVGLEVFIWIASMVYLAFIFNPSETHFTICPIANLGFEFCPGCGLGRSISFLFKGDIASSFNSHPLGIFALIIILNRIITLIKNNRRRYAERITVNANS
jgi:hypothetical protein